MQHVYELVRRCAAEVVMVTPSSKYMPSGGRLGGPANLLTIPKLARESPFVIPVYASIAILSYQAILSASVYGTIVMESNCLEGLRLCKVPFVYSNGVVKTFAYLEFLARGRPNQAIYAIPNIPHLLHELPRGSKRQIRPCGWPYPWLKG